MTLDEAIKELEERAYWKRDAAEMAEDDNGIGNEVALAEAAEDEQLAEWLTELKEAKSIIRVCNRVLGFLLDCEIENTSTSREVETLLKNITEYLSGGGENGS